MLVHLLRREFSSLGFMNHPYQRLSFMFSAFGIERHYDFSGFCHMIVEAQESEAFFKGRNV